MSQALSEQLGQPVIIDNRPGAAGTLGVTIGLQAPADGYTFIWCTPAAQVIAPASVRYDPSKDIAPVSMLVSGAYLLVVNPQHPYQSVDDLIQAARNKPGAVNYATAGAGTFGHLVGAAFCLSAKLEMTQIPFNGESGAIVGVMSGEVPVGFISTGGALAHVKSGKLRALGLSSASRIEGVPEDIPLLSSAVPGFSLVAINYMGARAGTSPAIIEKMNRAIQAVMAMPSVRERIVALGVTPSSSTSEELGARVTAERARMKNLLQQANITLG